MTGPNNMNLETRTRAIELLKTFLVQYKIINKINKQVLKDSDIDRIINPSTAEQLKELINKITSDIDQNIWIFRTHTTNPTILELRYELLHQEQKFFMLNQKITERINRYYRTH